MDVGKRLAAARPDYDGPRPGRVADVIQMTPPETALDREKDRNADSGGNIRADGVREPEAFRYAGGELGRRADGWVAASTSANSEISGSEPWLRDRARQLVRDNPYAANFVNTFADYAVGEGIKPVFESANDERRWEEWIPNADVEGQYDFYGLEHLIARAIVESGEVLIWRRSPTFFDEEADGTKKPMEVKLQLKILEPDYIDVTKTKGKGVRGKLSDGIEYNKDGRKIAYWIFRRHPGDDPSYGDLKSYDSHRVLAKDIIHVFHPRRPDQSRGVTWLAPIMMSLFKIGRYLEHDLERVRAQATQLGAVKRMTGAAGPIFGGALKSGTSANDNPMQAEWVGGTVNVMYPDEDIEWHSPSLSDNFEPYVRTMLQGLSVAEAIPYAFLSGDTQGLSWSNLRGVNLRFKQRVRSYQRHTLIAQALYGIYEWYRQAGSSSDVTGPGGKKKPRSVNIKRPTRWQLPKWEEIDRVKEAQADVLEVRGGIELQESKIAERGYGSLKTFVKATAKANKMTKESGVVWDSQPHNLSRQGQVHTDAPWFPATEEDEEDSSGPVDSDEEQDTEEVNDVEETDDE